MDVTANFYALKRGGGAVPLHEVHVFKLPPEATRPHASEETRLLNFAQNGRPKQEETTPVDIVVAEDGTCSVSTRAEAFLDERPNLRHHRSFIIAVVVKFFLFNCILVSILFDEGFNHLFLYAVALVYAVMLPLYALVLLAIPRQSLLLFCPALLLSLVSAFVLYLNILISFLRLASNRAGVSSGEAVHIVLDLLLVITETLLLVHLCKTFGRFMDQLQKREVNDDGEQSTASTWTINDYDDEGNSRPTEHRWTKMGIC
ncbi:unnamed protein product, partial [Mesorhabditis spiculigera]